MVAEPRARIEGSRLRLRAGEADETGVRGSALARLFPLGAVVVPFVVSRLLSAAFIAVGATVFADRSLTLQEFAQFDGNWYAHIAQHGYSIDYVPGVQSAWPFFPLLPAVMRLAAVFAVPVEAGALVVNHAVFLLGLAGVYRIASRHAPDGAARLAVWAVALFPTSFLFSMVYPEAIVFTASVWAFILLEDRLDLAAGAAAAVATLARPNGVLVAVALAFGVGRAWRRLPAIVGPSVVALGAWLVYVWVRTGDPRTIYWAKDGWHEVTLGMFFGGGRDTLTVLPHLALGLAVAAALVIERRHIPLAWMAFTGLWILPSLWLGMVGIGRYAAGTFPPFVAAGRILHRWGTAAWTVAFAMAIVGQMAACYWVNWVKGWQTIDPGLLVAP